MKKRLIAGVVITIAFLPCHDAAAQRRRAVTPPRPAAPQTYEIDTVDDVVYETVNGANVLMDYSRPRTESRFLPVIINIHGGGFHTGDRKGPRDQMQQLARHGYFSASIDYRLLPVMFPAQIEDVKAAIRFVRAHAAEFGIDSDTIGLWGVSVGGYLVNLAGTAGDVDEWNHSGGSEGFSSRVAAVVDFDGRSDLTVSGCNQETVWDPLIGCVCPESWRAASPTANVTPDDPPFLIQDGDGSCSSAESIKLDGALRAAGVRSELHLDYGEGASGCPANMTPIECAAQAEQRAIDFLDSILLRR